MRANVHCSPPPASPFTCASQQAGMPSTICRSRIRRRKCKHGWHSTQGRHCRVRRTRRLGYRRQAIRVPAHDRAHLRRRERLRSYLAYSLSRLLRDTFGLEFYLRKLAKHGVRLVSITQELGDDPAQVMMRQVIALFDECQSKESGKHVLRSVKESAHQGYWNGDRPPFGYRAIEVARRARRIDKKLAIDPVEAETVRLMFKLFLRAPGHVRRHEHVVQPGRPGRRIGPL